MFNATGRNQHTKKDSTGGDTKLSQREMAKEAGLSKRRVTTAVRAASVPENEREEMIESDDPPSVTKLVEMEPAQLVNRHPH